MHSLEDLQAYSRSYAASLEVHRLSLKFPAYEQYKGLASQLRDSSKSIVANLVEGYSFRVRRPKRFVNHLELSIGSCDETRLWLKYSYDLGYLTEREYDELAMKYEEIGKLLWGLLKSMRLVP